MVRFLIIVCICSFVQGFLSFGGGIILLPSLTSMFDLKLVVLPFFALYNAMTNTMNAWTYRKDIRLTDYKVLLIAGFLGALFGANIILNLVNKDALEWIIIVLIICNFIFTTFNKVTLQINKKTQALVGFLSGLFSGSVGLGSFGIAIGYQGIGKNPLKSLIAQFCLMSNFLTIISFIFQRRFTEEIILYFLISFLPALISQKLGIVISEKIKSEDFKKVLNAVLLGFALILMIR